MLHMSLYITFKAKEGEVGPPVQACLPSPGEAKGGSEFEALLRYVFRGVGVGMDILVSHF